MQPPGEMPEIVALGQRHEAVAGAEQLRMQREKFRLRAEPQRDEPVVDTARGGQRADAGDVHEAHFHALASDIIELSRELFEGNEGQWR